MGVTQEKTMKTRATIALLALLCLGLPAQNTLIVPSAAHPTIQSGINAATWGDTVHILPGTYYESLVITGKAITLEGSGSSLTTIDGLGIQRCLEIIGPGALTVIMEVTVRDLHLTSGTPPTVSPTNAAPVGGGILVRQGVYQVDLVDCEISWCKAPRGGGVYAESGVRLQIDGCHFHHDGWAPPSVASSYTPQGGAVWCSTWLHSNDSRYSDCSIVNAAGWNVGSRGGAVFMGTQGWGELAFNDCEFARNHADDDGAVSAPGLAQASFTRCRFLDNLANSAAAVRLSAPQFASFSYCLFAGNDAPGAAKVLDVGSDQISIDRCTFSNNGPANASGRPIVLRTVPSIALVVSPQSVYFAQSIVTGNGDDRVRIECTPATTVIIDRDILGAVPEILNWSTLAPIIPSTPPVHYLSDDAGLIDEAAGDHHLRPGALATDSGRDGSILATPFTGFDLDGNPALVGQYFDIGCYELQNRDPGTAWAGSVPDGAGQTFDSLTINGTAGGLLRRFVLPVSTPVTIGMDPAPGDTFAHFVVFGYYGLPRLTDAIPIPFAQGTIVFAPEPLVPFSPAHITLADSTGAFPALIWAPPAPWTATGLTSPMPARLTLQAFQTVGPTDVRLSNALVIDVQ